MFSGQLDADSQIVPTHPPTPPSPTHTHTPRAHTHNSNNNNNTHAAARLTWAAPPGQDADGSYFIDRDGATFRHVLNYLRDGTLPRSSSEEMRTEMKMEASFYQIPQLMMWAQQGHDAMGAAHQEAELVLDAFRGSAHRFLVAVYGRSSDVLISEAVAHLATCAEQGATTGTLVFYQLIEGSRDFLVPKEVGGSIEEASSSRVAQEQLPTTSPGLEVSVEVLVQTLEEKGFPCQCLSGQGLDGRVVVDIQHTRPAARDTAEKSLAADSALMLRDIRSTTGLMLDQLRQMMRATQVRSSANTQMV